MLLGIAGAPDGLAQGARAHAARAGHGGGVHQRGHAAGGSFHGRYVTPYRAYSYSPYYPYYPRAYYAPAAYYGSTSAPSYARPALYYVPPISANAPMFSFDGSPAVEPDWGWQRVNLQQLAAEVRAKREAAANP
jgi:hypothetical protein